MYGRGSVVILIAGAATIVAAASASPAAAAGPSYSSLPGYWVNGTWGYRDSLTSGGNISSMKYGPANCAPVTGDWNGDGTKSAGVFCAGTWHLRNSNVYGPADITFAFGAPGDVPIVGDWNGDGVDTVGTVTVNGVGQLVWYERDANSAGLSSRHFVYGVRGDQPVVGDWNGDRTDTVGTVAVNRWYLRNSNSAGMSNVRFTYGVSGAHYFTWNRPRTAAPVTGTSRVRVPTSRPIVALTFDAGSGAEGVANILATLNSRGAVATFMLTGNFVQAHPDLARQIAARYPVGNHTVSHPYLTRLTDSQVASEVNGAESIISSTTGQTTRPLFRLPYGDYNSRVLADVNGLGYTSFWWTVDTLGWEGVRGGQSVSTVRQRVVSSLQPGEIVLMHVGAAEDGTTLDADALSGVISDLKARGYGFVTLRQYL